jgi:hypothetical protein
MARRPFHRWAATAAGAIIVGIAFSVGEEGDPGPIEAGRALLDGERVNAAPLLIAGMGLGLIAAAWFVHWTGPAPSWKR